MEYPSLSMREKELIRESWGQLGKEKLQHGTVLFSRLFELDPDLVHLFHYNTTFATPAECLTSPEFLDHIHKVMSVIDAAVNNLENLPSLEEYLINLGKKHKTVGVKIDSFPAVGESLLYMLERALGTPLCTEIKAAWIVLYTFVTKTMIRGWDKNGENKIE